MIKNNGHNYGGNMNKKNKILEKVAFALLLISTIALITHQISHDSFWSIFFHDYDNFFWWMMMVGMGIVVYLNHIALKPKP
ncbi:TPA: hypothetical protein DCZ32_01620 [Candidatus Uhrbacteria bacterium]|nr:hypothetical protein [Candidatus Uhrbacteria bacterium]